MTEIDPQVLQRGYEMRRLMNDAVRLAHAEAREFGVPTTYDVDGHTFFELPDGTILTEDPWHGHNTPPEDWPWLDRWEKNVGEKLEERCKRAAGLSRDQ